MPVDCQTQQNYCGTGDLTENDRFIKHKPSSDTTDYWNYKQKRRNLLK
tara:strand:- start:40 stop:183 length:144 start_codon:yes stop_codon:yes gene_type:complete